MTTIDRITTPNAPKPAGHYSQACVYRDLIFVSGQLPVSLEGKARADMSVRGTGASRAWQHARDRQGRGKRP